MIVWALMVGYVCLYSWLAILRHQSFGSSAMDLGFTDQALWNTLRGRPFLFSTLENAPIDLPLETFRRTDILLSYHVEPLLLPISLLYLVFEDPIAILVLQVVVVTLGAWPAYLLAREHLGSPWAGLAFALAYLLAPPIQGAILSDFHAVSLTACLLLYALYFAHVGRHRAFLAVVTLAMFAKEDIPLLVAAIGVYLFLFRRERKLGLITVAMGLGWFLVCTQVILPHFNGLDHSPYLPRMALFGDTVIESVQNVLRDPRLLWDWLRQPEIISYLTGLLASTGFLSLFAPVTLGMAAPILAMNVLSKWSWTYSQGEHYSASIVPFLIVSAIYGTGALARIASKRLKIPYHHALLALSLWMIAAAGFHHYRIGVSPLARTFYPPRVTEHHRLGREIIGRIPRDASVSAQSNLYPHLSHRREAYFFPAINGADYVLLDVTGSTYPITPRGLYLSARQLLRSGEFRVMAAEDGYLLLERSGAPVLAGDLPESFYGFARRGPTLPDKTLSVRFGDALELVGCEYTILNLVEAHGLPVTVATYWRTSKPLEMDYQFSLFFTRDDGAIVYHYDGGTSTTWWYPPYRWQVGEVVRMDTPILTAGRLRDVLVGVTPPGTDPWASESRLVPVILEGDAVELVDQGTLLKACSLP